MTRKKKNIKVSLSYILTQHDKEMVKRCRPKYVPPVNIVLSEDIQWWQKASIKYAFSHPHVRSRLEKLMGSNVVKLLNREYMQKLQERILETYAASMEERIQSREAEERERVKNLVLTRKIPLDNAPPSMADHPVMLIEMYCRKLIAERRAKIKELKVLIPTHLYSDDTPDPPSGLSIEKGHMFRSSAEKLCKPPFGFLATTDEQDLEGGYMMNEEDFQKQNYEDPLVRELRECETVPEMYSLANEIIGELKTVEHHIAPAAEKSNEIVV